MLRREALSKLPKVDRVLGAAVLAGHPVLRSIQRQKVQEALAELRAQLCGEEAGELAASIEVPTAEELAATIARRLDALIEPRPRRALNATGVVLHTNLGRAPMSGEVTEAIAAAAGACDLELELATGLRGSRYAHLRPLLAAVVGAEDVHVVGNGAAALLIACTALGSPGGVVLSRGQMIEIGDGFRVAEMAAAGGAAIWAVGSTNRTHEEDYRRALAGELPGMSGPASAILWAHLSNFRQEGFVAEVELEVLAKLAAEHGVPLIADLGSGSLGAGIPGNEPTIAEYLDAGVDVVTCSGDKLFGGPQAGILAGRAATVGRLRRHPMARALRPGKLTVAGLQATAAAHARGDAARSLGLHRLLAATPEMLRVRARRLAEALAWPESALRTTVATIGGGSLPGATIEGVALAVPGGSASRRAAILRRLDPPIIGRIVDGELLIDLRSLPAEDDAVLLAGLRSLA